MELFDKKFVYFMWDDVLEGKKCFVADSIGVLQRNIEGSCESRSGHIVESGDDNYPFMFDDIDERCGSMYQFAYYDPNYEAKWEHYKGGKKVQAKKIDSFASWVDCDEPHWSKEYCYRVKPEEEEQWIAYLARENDGVCYLTAGRKDRWEKVQKYYRAKTKLFVGSEDEVREWYKSREKFKDLIKAWEDGKTIQVYEALFKKWGDCARTGTLEWHTDCEYRVKPEDKAVVAKRCSGCVHEHCSAIKEPCVSCKPGNSKYEEKKWRPYESSAEMIADFIARFKVNCPSYCEPLIWVKTKGDDARFLMTGFGKKVSVDGVGYSLDELLKYYTYLDGSPVGMEVKE